MFAPPFPIAFETSSEANRTSACLVSSLMFTEIILAGANALVINTEGLLE